MWNILRAGGSSAALRRGSLARPPAEFRAPRHVPPIRRRAKRAASPVIGRPHVGGIKASVALWFARPRPLKAVAALAMPLAQQEARQLSATLLH